MISVVIVTAHDPAAVASLLEELVPAAVNGLVREVLVPSAESTPASRAIADDAGAVLVEGAYDAAINAAKSSWVMVLEASRPRAADWLQKVARHVSLDAGGEWRIAGRWPWSVSAGVLRRRGAR
jgi:hypothetical protein